LRVNQHSAHSKCHLGVEELFIHVSRALTLIIF
jgi:hypothetical protein